MNIPDHTTVWCFRERLIKTNKDKVIWKELQKQLEEKVLKIRKGVIQDATLFTTDPGNATSDTPRGNDAKTRRNKEGTWTIKRKKSYFGFKHHTKEDCDFGLIRALQTTTVTVHDSQINLSENGEGVYWDRGYFGTEPKGFDATMQ